MQNYNKYEPTDVLDLINKVDAPPFLLTRIKQKIESSANKVSPVVLWTTCISVCLVFIVNIYAISDTGKHKNDTAHSLAEAMNLYPNNSLYE